MLIWSGISASEINGLDFHGFPIQDLRFPEHIFLFFYAVFQLFQVPSLLLENF